jgi:hypothetical protein
MSMMKSLRYRILIITVILLTLAWAFLIINTPSNAFPLVVVWAFIIAIVVYVGIYVDVLPTS